MDDINIYFHLKWRNLLLLICVILFSSVLYHAIPNQQVMHIVLSIFNLVVSVYGVWFLSSVEITKDGLALYKINRLKWQDITSAKRTSFLGLPYILLRRKKGTTWWLPLYYVGESNFQTTLLNVIPSDNPIRDSLL